MMHKVQEFGRKKHISISKYLKRSKVQESSLIYSLEKMGGKVENLKKAKQKCYLIKAETKKDRRRLKKIYMSLEEKRTRASSQHAKLCETKLPFEQRLWRCLWWLKRPMSIVDGKVRQSLRQ